MSCVAQRASSCVERDRCRTPGARRAAAGAAPSVAACRASRGCARRSWPNSPTSASARPAAIAREAAFAIERHEPSAARQDALDARHPVGDLAVGEMAEHLDDVPGAVGLAPGRARRAAPPAISPSTIRGACAGDCAHRSSTASSRSPFSAPRSDRSGGSAAPPSPPRPARRQQQRADSDENGPAAAGSTSNSTLRSAGAAAPARRPARPPARARSAAMASRHHVLQILGRPRAERRANRHLAPPQRHAERRDRVDAGRRQQQREDGERADEPQVHAPRRQRDLERLVHRPHRRRRHVGDRPRAARAGTRSRSAAGSPLVRTPQYMLLFSHCTVASGTCAIGDVDVGRHLRVEAVVLHVADNADDRAPAAADRRRRSRSSGRRAGDRPEPPRERPADQHHGLAGGCVMFVERSSRNQRHAKGPNVRWTDHPVLRLARARRAAGIGRSAGHTSAVA